MFTPEPCIASKNGEPPPNDFQPDSLQSDVFCEELLICLNRQNMKLYLRHRVVFPCVVAQ